MGTFYSHHVFKNPRFSISNYKGENIWSNALNHVDKKGREYVDNNHHNLYKGDFRSEYAVDGKIIQDPNYLFAHSARGVEGADFLVDINGKYLLNLVTLYTRQDCGNSRCAFSRNEHTVVFIRDALGTEVVCNPRYLYNGKKMRKLLIGQLEESRLFFDCVRDVVGVALRVSNQQFYKSFRDHLQIVEIQVGYKERSGLEGSYSDDIYSDEMDRRINQ